MIALAAYGMLTALLGAAVAPIPTADQTPAASDHDAVVGHFGLEARRFDPGPVPLLLQPGVGCPAASTDACSVTMGALAVRYWMTRNLAVDGGLAFVAGGGREGDRSFDAHAGGGPILGVSVLVGNWRHLSIAASPEMAFVWFRPGGQASSTYTFALRGALEGELHFGFVGVPALSVGLVAGVGFTYETAGADSVWSLGVLGGESIWGTLSGLFVRYYL